MSTRRLNIIMIVTDQQRFDTIRALNAPHMDTPNLDKMVKEGIALTNCFTASPICIPARASLFTGCYPNKINVLSNKDKWSPELVQTLANSGYHCVNIGKMHSGWERGGFHQRFIVENKDRNLYLDNYEKANYDEWDKYLANRGLQKPSREGYKKHPFYETSLGAYDWPLDDKAHSDFFVGNMALWWLEQRQSTAPLFLQIGFPGPHPPYDPIKRYTLPYLKKDLPIPDIDQESLLNQPYPQAALREEMIEPKAHGSIKRAEFSHDGIRWMHKPNPEQLHRLRAYYYANVTMIDEKVGEIFSALEEKGYLENSIIIFTSDHGDALGEHGHIQKWTMYDSVVRIPMVIWAPWLLEGGRQIEELTQQMDIAPTILQWAGQERPSHWDARSLIPVIKEERGRDYVFAEYGRGKTIFREAELVTMVRSRDWKLVYYMEVGRTDGELYDLKNDPEENDNLWNKEEHSAKQSELLNVLKKWRMKL